MFGEPIGEVAVNNLPFFVPSELFWGFGLIIFSIIFSYFIWHYKMGLSIKGIFAWLLNLVIFVFALLKISAAFPRLPFGITFGVLFVLVIVIAGGTVAVSKKEEEKGSENASGGDSK